MPPDISFVFQSGRGKREDPKAFSDSTFVFCRRDNLSRDSHQHSCVTGLPLAKREAGIVSDFNRGSDHPPKSGLFLKKGLNASQVASSIFCSMAV